MNRNNKSKVVVDPSIIVSEKYRDGLWDKPDFNFYVSKNLDSLLKEEGEGYDFFTGYIKKPPSRNEIASALSELEKEKEIKKYSSENFFSQLKDERFLSPSKIESKYEELTSLEKIHMDNLLFLLTQSSSISKFISRLKKSVIKVASNLPKVTKTVQKKRPLIEVHENIENPHLANLTRSLKEATRWVAWAGSFGIIQTPILSGFSGSLVEGIRLFVVDP